MDAREAREARTEELIRVRRVTQLHAAWTEAERGAPGAFTSQRQATNRTGPTIS